MWDVSHAMNDTLIKEIRRRMLAAGLNPSSLSRKAGLKGDYVRDILRGKSRKPNAADLGKIAAVLGCHITDLLPDGEVAPQQSADLPGLREQVTPFDRGSRVTRSSDRSNFPINDRIDDLPIYGTGFCGEHGRFDMNGQVVDYASRPERLRGIASAYAIYAVGSSMEPRYFAGELLYVHPGRPITPGCFVVVQLQPEHEGDTVQAFVKQFVRMDNNVVVVRELNPVPREFSLPRANVLDIHRIVQSGESG